VVYPCGRCTPWGIPCGRCTPWVYPRCGIPGYTLGVVYPGYTLGGVYNLVYSLPGVYITWYIASRCTSRYTHPGVHPCIPTLVYIPVYPPWYTPPSQVHLYTRPPSVACRTVSGTQAGRA